VKTLRFPESIQSNPGMYIGGTDASGIWHIPFCDED
jgi:DNA gyrase/topoisomerase IV subunit B